MPIGSPGSAVHRQRAWRPRAWLTLCLAEAEPEKRWCPLSGKKNSAVNYSSGSVFVWFSGLWHTPEKSPPETAWRSDVWCAFQQLSTECPGRSQAPCALSVLNISPRFSPARNRDQRSAPPTGGVADFLPAPVHPLGEDCGSEALIIDDSFSSCKFHHFAEIPLVLMGTSMFA